MQICTQLLLQVGTEPRDSETPPGTRLEPRCRDVLQGGQTLLQDLPEVSVAVPRRPAFSFVAPGCRCLLVVTA